MTSSGTTYTAAEHSYWSWSGVTLIRTFNWTRGICRYLHGHVTDKNDVYSFGVVLLELISGRRAVISKDLDIVQWAAGYTGERPIGPLARMADPQIQVGNV